MSSVWNDLVAMKAKFDSDWAIAELTAKECGFINLRTLPHGEWAADSSKSAKHKKNLRAVNAQNLIFQMKEARADADKKKTKSATANETEV